MNKLLCPPEIWVRLFSSQFTTSEKRGRPGVAGRRFLVVELRTDHQISSLVLSSHNKILWSTAEVPPEGKKYDVIDFDFAPHPTNRQPQSNGPEHIIVVHKAFYSDPTVTPTNFLQIFPWCVLSGVPVDTPVEFKAGQSEVSVEWATFIHSWKHTYMHEVPII